MSVLIAGAKEPADMTELKQSAKIAAEGRCAVTAGRSTRAAHATTIDVTQRSACTTSAAPDARSATEAAFAPTASAGSHARSAQLRIASDVFCQKIGVTLSPHSSASPSAASAYQNYGRLLQALLMSLLRWTFLTVC
jgi:hypothetical protein